MNTTTLSTVEELAELSMGKSIVVMVVGDGIEAEAIIGEIIPLLMESESIVQLDQNSKLFDTLERPAQIPALGVWTAKGAFVGYREPDESINEFLKDARRFA